ncbi:MAG: DUF5801 repeats-in-toxin domain-containing protein [Synechococcus sp. WH 8007]|nr:DUF5801 repeats-in-toxin domain-containing protein [Synechococcus sp. WH 8007]
MVTLTGTVIDANGSKASAGLAIGQMLHFKDDGPTLELKEGGHPPIITVDESFIGHAGASNSANFANAFSASHNAGQDGELSFSSSYQLLTSDGTDSGLIDSDSGKHILLYTDQSGHVVGRVDGPSGDKALEISVDQNGVVSFSTLRAVQHPDSANPDEPNSLAPGSLVLQRTDTVVDKDGDSAYGKASVDLGSALSIKDDAPTLSLGASNTPQAITVDESFIGHAGASNSANFANAFSASHNAGQDGELSFSSSYQLLTSDGTDSGLIDSDSGKHILLYTDQSGHVVGRVDGPSGDKALEISVDQNGVVSFSTLRAVQHPDSANPDEPNSLAPGSLVLQRTDTVVDKDGDSAYGKASVDLGSALSIKDDAPTLSLGASNTPQAITVDESFIGHAGASNSANFANAFSASHNAGQDGELSFSSSYQLLTSDGTDSGLIDSDSGKHILLYTDQSGHVVGRVDGPSGDKALEISVDQNGVVSFSTLRAVQHPDSANPDEPNSLAPGSLVLQRTDTVVDKDGDSAYGKASVDLGSALSIKDDAPTLSLGASNTPQAITVDESFIGHAGASNSANFANAFSASHNAGQDGELSFSSSYQLLTSDGTDSGLIDSDSGKHILLYTDQSGHVVGRVDGPSGDKALEISVDQNGVVSFSTLRAVQHPDSANPDEPNSLAPGSLVLQRTDTVVDKDGDSAYGKASVDLGSALSIKDDAPTLSLGASNTPQAITVDESFIGHAGASNSANFANAFSASHNAGQDGELSFSSSYQLLTSDGTDSGLIDSDSGKHILLYTDQSGHVVGRVDGPSGDKALEISVDQNGVVSFSTLRAVQHPDSANPDEPNSLAPGSLVLQRTDTVVDKDGDSAYGKASVDLGSALSIKDDAPTLSLGASNTPQAITVDESFIGHAGASNSANFANAFSASHNAGQDGELSFSSSYQLLTSDGTDSGLIDSDSGKHILLYTDQSGHVVGRVDGPSGDKALEISVDQNGVVSFSTLRAVQHPDSANPDEPNSLAPGSLVLQRTDTVVDKDGDSAYGKASVDLGSALSIKDDAPTLSLGASNTPQAITVDESFIGHAGASNSANFANAFSASHNAGQDGELSFSSSYQLLTSDGTDSGLIDSDSGKHILLYTDQSGHVVGRVDGPSGDKALEISVDQNGVVSFSTLRAVQHPDSANPDEPNSLAPGSLVLQRTDTVVDKDGDSAYGKASVDLGSALSIKDDAPTLSLGASNTPQAITVDESFIGHAGASNSANFANAFSASHNAGQDGELSFSSSYQLLTSDGTDSGLIDSDSGKHILLYTDQSGHVVGRVDGPSGDKALEISVDQNGVVSFSTLRAVQHPDSANPDEPNSLAPGSLVLQRTDTVVDKDGDSAYGKASVDLGSALSIKDDAPTLSLGASNTPQAITVDESFIGHAGASNSANFANAFSASHNAGQDGELSFSSSYQLLTSDGTDSGLIDSDSGKHILLYTDQSGHVVGRVDGPSGDKALEISVDQNGVVSFSTLRAVQHPDSANPDEPNSLAPGSLVLQRTDTVVDKDGDSAYGKASVDLGSALSIKDDAPTLSLGASNTPQAITVDESFIGHAGASNSANFANAFSASHNAGQDGELSFSSSYQLLTSDGTDSGLIDSDSGKHILLYTDQSGHVVGRVDGPSGDKALEISVDQNGVVSFSTLRAVQHPDSANPDEPNSLAPGSLVLQRTDTVVDKDGDSAYGKASVDLGSALSIKDDAPTLSLGASNTPQAITVDESFIGHAGASNSANFANAFSASHNAGQDGELSFSSSYQLLTSDGTDSGLIDSDSGKHILLYTDQSGHVVGRVDGPSGDKALEISVDQNGVVSFSTLRAVQHPDSANPDEPNSLAPGSLVLQRTDTVVDKDGDSAYGKASVDLGSALSIKDDAPTLSLGASNTPQAITVDESFIGHAGASNSANFANAFSASHNAGQDGELSFSSSYQLLTSDGTDSGLIDSDSGKHILLYTDQSGHVVGRVDGPSGDKALEISVDQNGVVSFSTLRAVQHPDSANPDEPNSLAPGSLVLQRTDTVVDKDGDSAYGKASVDLGSALSIKDDAPTLSLGASNTPQAITVDESFIGHAGASNSANFANAFSASHNAGQDGELSFSSSYQLLTSDGTDSGLIDSDSGKHILLYTDQSGHVVGRVDGPSGDKALEISVDQNGVVSFSTLRAVQHPDSANPDEPNSLAPGSLVLQRTDTVVDKDGDSAYGKASVDLGSALSIKDDAPTLSLGASNTPQAITVDESFIGHAGASNSANFANAFSASHNAGQDGELSFSSSYQLLTSDGTDSGLIDSDSGKHILLYTDQSGHVVGRVDGPSGDKALEISVDQNGVVSFSTLRAVQHPDSANPDEPNSLAPGSLVLQRTDTVVDKDGDSAYGKASVDLGSALSIKDDAPTLSLGASNTPQAITVDESFIGHAGASNSANFANAFSASHNAGQDGELSFSSSYQLLTSDGTDSGLIDSDSGKHILLYTDQSGHVVGRVDGPSGDKALEISVDQNGVVSFSTLRAVQHPDSANPDEPNSLAPGSLVLQRTDTVVDKDGDSAYGKASVDLGSALSIKDDAPTLSLGASNTPQAITVDESFIGHAGASNSANFANAFSASHNAGQDGELSFSSSYQLLTSDGTDSGLIDSDSGKHILLYTDQSGHVVGRVDGPSGDKALEISVDQNGVVSFSTLRAVQHPDSANPDEPNSLAPGSLVLQRTDTVVDKDGDSAYGKASVDLGSALSIKDDAPTLSLGASNTPQAITVDESFIGHAGASNSANFANAFSASHNAGQDGELSFSSSYQLLTSDGTDSGLIDSDSGKHILLYTDQSGHVVGRVDGPSGDKALEISVDQNGVVSFSTLRAVQHPDSANPDEPNSLAPGSLVLQRTDTVVDKDGDSAYGKASVDLGSALSIKDDAPTLSLGASNTPQAITVDESFIGHAGASNSANFANAFSASHNAGQDGELSFSSSYQLLTSDGTDSGLIDSDSGKHILLYTDQSGHVVGRVDGPSGDKALEISVDQNGVVSFSTLRAVQHPDSANPDEPNSLAPGSLVLQRTDTVVDKDGDSAYGKASVDLGSALSIKDDAPTLSLGASNTPQAITVDESFIGHAGASNSANFANAFSASHNAGQDGELSFSSSYQLLTSDGTDSGLIDSDSGKHILLYTDQSGHVVGRVDGPSGDKALEISVDQNGVVSFSTLRAVQHPDSANPDEPNSLAPGSLVLQRTDTVVDKDGDSAYGKASVDLGSALSIKDDAPTLSLGASNTPQAITVDESFIGHAGASNSANFANAFSASHNAGQDGELSFSSSYQLLTSDGTDSGLIDSDSGKHILLYTDQSGHVVGRVDGPSGDKALEISVDQNGVVSFSTLRAVQHPDSANPDEPNSLAPGSLVLQRTDTVVDKDGDSAYGKASVDLGSALSIKDDAPTLSLGASNTPQAITVDESFIGHAGASNSANFANAFSASHNAGQDGELSFSSSYQLLTSDGTDSGLIDLKGNHIFLYNDGHGGVFGVAGNGSSSPLNPSAQPHALDLSVNPSGQVSFSANSPVQHDQTRGQGSSISLNPGSVQLERTDIITDGDGDKAYASAQTDISSELRLNRTDDPFSDENEIYTIKAGETLTRNLLDNASAHQTHDGKVQILSYSIGNENLTHPPDQTVHLAEGDLRISKDGDLIFTPKPGYSGQIPTINYNLTDDGTTVGDTSSAQITVTQHRLIDDNEFAQGTQDKPITGNLIQNAVYDNQAKASCSIVEVFSPDGQKLSQDPTSHHFTGILTDGHGHNIGKLDVDPSSGEYTFTPEKGWSGFIGDQSIHPIAYTVQDKNGVSDGSILAIQVDPSWVTSHPQPTSGGHVQSGHEAPDVAVAPGYQHYYIARSGEDFDPKHPSSTGSSALGTVSVDKTGHVHFTGDQNKQQEWARNHQDLVQVVTQTIDNKGTQPQTSRSTITNPSGRTLGVAQAPPGWSRGKAWWKHPTTGEIMAPPSSTSGTGRLGFSEEWVVYNEKGEAVGNYWVTADLKLTTTTTHNYVERNMHPTGGWKHADMQWVDDGHSTTTTTAEITHITAGATAPTPEQATSQQASDEPQPDGSFNSEGLEVQDISVTIAETVLGTLQDEHKTQSEEANSEHQTPETASTDSSRNDINDDTSDHKKDDVSITGESEPSIDNLAIDKSRLNEAVESIKSAAQPSEGGSEKAPQHDSSAHETHEIIDQKGSSDEQSNPNQPASTNGLNSQSEEEASRIQGSFLQQLVTNFQATTNTMTEENTNPVVQDVAASTLADPFSEPKQVQPPDDLSSSEPAEDYQPLLDPQDNPDQLM